jgi:hypothetical protein
MSRNGDIVLSLGGEERTFRFGLAEHRRVQEKLNVGVSEVLQNLHLFVQSINAGLTMRQVLDHQLLGKVRPDQIREVLFQGLVGGGMDPEAAGRLCKEWVDAPRPVKHTAPIAYAVAEAALLGPDDEDAAGNPAGAEAGSPSPTAKSGSVKTASMRSARRAASPRKISIA